MRIVSPEPVSRAFARDRRSVFLVASLGYRVSRRSHAAHTPLTRRTARL